VGLASLDIFEKERLLEALVPKIELLTRLLAGMAGLHGMTPRVLIGTQETMMLVALMAIALCCPNLREIMAQEELILAAMHRRADAPAPFPTLAIRWRPTAAWATACVGLFVVSLLQMTHISQFLYFQF
jgi:hypothetical protein